MEYQQQAIKAEEQGKAAAAEAEWDYKTAVGIAEALAKSEVRWVPEIMMNGNSGGGSAMDAVGLNMMMDVVKKMNESK